MSAADILKDSDMTLAPSTRGMGPNTYLGMQHFYATLVAALLVHLAILTVYSLWPKQKVTDIPVRALSFKIGGQNRVAAYGTPEVPTPAPRPVMQPKSVAKPPAARTNEWRPAKIEPPARRQRPVDNVQAPTPVPEPVTEPVLIAPAPQPVPQPAIAPEPQRYIREYGAPQTAGLGIENGALGGRGTENMMTNETAETVRARYEQIISVWIERHKIYPQQANRAEGIVQMRVRVDRQGYVRYYVIERSSGNAALDSAAIEMIRRANPVPAAPPNYPAENLIEFLIPISFKAP